jgi:hypothetical protein
VTVLVLDLMHAVEWRACAYEKRCETNSRQYTPLRDRSQASRSVEHRNIVLRGLALLPTVGNSIVLGNTFKPDALRVPSAFRRIVVKVNP